MPFPTENPPTRVDGGSMLLLQRRRRGKSGSCNEARVVKGPCLLQTPSSVRMAAMENVIDSPFKSE